jgi:hypothetical protein
MRWLKPNLRGSIYAIFSSSFPSGTEMGAEEIGMEDIREAMLAAIAETGADRAPQLTRRVRYAADVQGLWYLRGDLMALMASTHGEAEARARIEVLSHMFKGILPAGLRSRPSPLDHK